MTPTPPPADPGLGAVDVTTELAAVLLLLGLAGILVGGLLRAGRGSLASTVVVSLSILTFLCIVVSAVVNEPALVTLAATGVGALAGVVSQGLLSDASKLEAGEPPAGLEEPPAGLEEPPPLDL